MRTAIAPKPLQNRVILRPEEAADKTPGGIVLPDNAKDKSARAKVLAVGPGQTLRDGTVGKMSVKVGDTVMFEKYAGEAFEWADEELLIISENNILAIVE